MRFRAALALGCLLLLSMATFGASGPLGSLPGHPLQACAAPFHVEGADWDLCWQLDEARAHGLELNQVLFHGEPVLWKIGVPFSLTRYEDDAFGPFKDILGVPTFGVNHGFGLGAMSIHPADCPRFLTTGVLLDERRLCVEYRGGPEPAVALWSRFNNFNYRFMQGYQLDARGVVEPFIRLGGTLIDGDEAPGAQATNHFHNVYWRVDFDVAAAGNDRLDVFLRPDEQSSSDSNASSGPGPLTLCDHQTQQGESGWWCPDDALDDLPEQCQDQATNNQTGWCAVDHERRLLHHHPLLTKWRVADAVDRNAHDHERGFEFVTRPDGVVDGNFSSFDVLLVRHQGDSAEIGFEVPFFPHDGDVYLAPYYTPSEAVDDPVAWVAVQAYHDTRDEDHPTMTYHQLGFTIQPRNFLDANVGEDTFDPRPLLPEDT